jgi:hypothetical protein
MHHTQDAIQRPNYGLVPAAAEKQPTIPRNWNWGEPPLRHTYVAMLRPIRALVAATGIVGVLAGCGAAAADTAPATNPAGRSPTVLVPAPPPSAAKSARPLDWGLVRVWLPPAWTPSRAAMHCHSQGFTELRDTVGIGLAPCHYPAGSPALTIARLEGAAPRGGQRERINAIPVITYSSDGLKNARVVVPALDAVLTAHDAAAAHIITTLQRSLGWDFVHAVRPTGWPARWQTVTYRGLTIDTPPSWQVQRIGYYPCDALGQDFPAVLRGTAVSVSGCTGGVFDAIPTTQGAAWIAPGPGQLPLVIGSSVTDHHNGITFNLAVVADSPAQVIIHVSGGVQGTVELAISPNPATPRSVLASIR